MNLYHIHRNTPSPPEMPTYVITGSNRGLGLEWVRQLSSVQDNIIVAAVRSLSSQNNVSALKESSKATIHVLECDTGSVTSMAAFPKALASALGSATAKIDFLINNAGMNIVPVGNSLDLDGEALAKTMSVNVYGPAKVVIELLPHLASGSVVVNVSSSLGSITVARGPKDAPPPSPAYTTYSITKAALNMLTVHQAGDLRDKGVTVISMDPGWVQTDMGGPQASLKPDESISGMRKVLEQLDSTATGRFYAYSGKEWGW